MQMLFLSSSEIQAGSLPGSKLQNLWLHNPSMLPNLLVMKCILILFDGEVV